MEWLSYIPRIPNNAVVQALSLAALSGLEQKQAEVPFETKETFATKMLLNLMHPHKRFKF